MILSNTDFNILYVDPSASASGDGSAPGSALTALPQSSSDIADKTCFLIRRTAASHEVQLPQGENSSITAMALIGMPKTTDALYALMPDEVKNAWGADAADYANVKAATRDEPWGDEGTQGLSLPGCLVFFLHRVNLYRDSQSSFESAIHLGNTEQKSSVSVECCRFGLKGCELEKSDFTSQPSWGAGMYLEIGKAQVLSIRHCVFNTIFDSSYYYEASSWAVNATGADFLTLNDIDVWSTTSPYGSDEGPGGSDPVFRLGNYNSYNSSYSGSCTNANCENIRVHYLQNGSGGYLPTQLYVYGGNDFICLRDVSIVMETRKLGSGTPSVVAPSGTLVYIENAGEFIYENLSAVLPQVWKVGYSCSIFKLTGSGASNAPGCAKRVRNITVTLGTDGGVDSSGRGNYYSEYQNGDSQYWYNHAALQLNFSSGSGREPLIVQNVNVTHPRGIALYVSNCYLRNCTLQGMLRASSATCDITSLASWYPGNAVGAVNGSTVRIGTLTLGKGNISGRDSDPAILGNPMESYCFIYVGTSNGQLMGDTRSTSTSYDNCYAVACANEQDTGHYTMRTLNAMCNTWGVARSGSSVTASLKLCNNTAEGKGFLSLGRQPFGGFKIQAEAGQKTLVIHMAAKGLSETAEIARHVLVQVSIPQEYGGAETVFSSTSGRWCPDDSLWIGESGLAAYRLEVPLDIPEACETDVKIHYRWYSASGYLYIDPEMTIE